MDVKTTSYAYWATICNIYNINCSRYLKRINTDLTIICHKQHDICLLLKMSNCNERHTSFTLKTKLVYRTSFSCFFFLLLFFLTLTILEIHVLFLQIQLTPPCPEFQQLLHDLLSLALESSTGGQVFPSGRVISNMSKG